MFLAFTLSQLGMVTRWWRRRASGWRRGMAVNGLGAALSAAVLLVVVATKFAQGAWLVVVLVPLLMATALAVHRHYAAVRRITAVASSKRPSARLQEDENSPSVVAVLCVVPVSRLDRPTLRALAYAAALGQPLLAVHLSPAPGEAARFLKSWRALGVPVRLELVHSPYRAVVAPLAFYLRALHAQRPHMLLTVIMPELVVRRRWHQTLHGRTPARLRRALRDEPNIVLTTVPFHLAA